MPFKYKLGLKKSDLDSRDHKYSSPQRNHNKVLPLKCEIPIIRCLYDQQDLNSCSSNVICNQIMSLKDFSDNTYPSRLFQYYVSISIASEEDKDEGCSYREAYQGLSKFGFTDEQFWPYDTSKVFDKPPQEAYDNANKTLVKRYKSVLQSLYSLKYAIYEGHPIAFGSMIFENFEPNKDGIIPLPSGDIVGNHAMLITAYDDNTRLFKVLNSWSSSWGINGCCYMRYDHILNSECCTEFWCLIAEKSEFIHSSPRSLGKNQR